MSNMMGVTGQSLMLALDAANLRQIVGASNIANANTPGYTPFRVRFEEQLAAYLANGSRAGASPLPTSLRPVVEPQVSPSGELTTGVLVDLEAAGLVQNTIHYQALLRAVRGQLDVLQTAINDGRR